MSSPPVQRRIIVAIVSITVTGILTNTLIGPAIPEILDEFGASDASAGYLIAAGSAPGILIAPLMGFLADRFGRKEVIVPCLVLFGVAGGLGGLAPSLPLLVVARAFQGAGSAGLINLSITVIGDHWEGTRRATVIGRNSALLTTAIAVLPFVGGVLTDLGGWRTVFAVYPVGLATAVGVWRWLPRGRRREVHIAAQLRDVRPALLRPSYLATSGATVITFALIFAFLLTILPVYIDRVLELGATARGVVLGLPAIGSTAGALATGRLTSRVGRSAVVTAAAALFAVSLGILSVVTALPAVILGIMLFGIGEGLTIPTLQDVAASAGTTEQRGTLVATQVGMARLGQTIGPLALAPLATTSLGYGGTYAVGAGLAALPLTLLARRSARPHAPAHEVTP